MPGTVRTNRTLRVTGAVIVALSLIPLVGAVAAVGATSPASSSSPAEAAPTEDPAFLGEVTNEGGPVEGSANPDARSDAPIDGTEQPGDSQVLGTKQGPSESVAGTVSTSGRAPALLLAGLALLVIGLAVLATPALTGRSRLNES